MPEGQPVFLTDDLGSTRPSDAADTSVDGDE